MSEDEDKEFPINDFDYLSARSILLLNMNLLRQELNYIWDKGGEKWKDKKFDTHLHSIAERKREILDIAHGLMTAEDYQQYADLVEVVLPVHYSKFDIKKFKKIKKKFD